MKILFFVQSLEGGGAERVVTNLSNYLDEQGHQITILMLYDHGVAYTVSERVRIECVYAQPQLLRTNWKRLLHAFKLINNSDVCVSFLSTTILLTLLLKPILKTKVICTERNYPPARYGERLQRRLKRWAHKADAWVFQTTQQREWYGGAVNDKNANVIPNAINKEFLQETNEIIEREKTIVTVGSLQEKKNHKLLIEAFSKIALKYPDYKLVIYGEGELREDLISFCKELGVSDRVDLAGFAENIPAKIKSASLFVLSSNVEGIPNALIEAMALGLPCISTRCAGGGAELLVENGKNGLLVPVKDVEAMTEAMTRVLSDDNLAKTLGKNAMQLRETLAPEVIYKKWYNVLEGVSRKK